MTYLGGDVEDEAAMSREVDDLHVMLCVDEQADGRDGCDDRKDEMMSSPNNVVEKLSPIHKLQ